MKIIRASRSFRAYFATFQLPKRVSVCPFANHLVLCTKTLKLWKYFNAIPRFRSNIGFWSILGFLSTKIEFCEHTRAKILYLSKNSHFENLNFDKIHIFKVWFFTKFTFSILIFTKIHIFKVWFFTKFTFFKHQSPRIFLIKSWICPSVKIGCLFLKIQ